MSRAARKPVNLALQGGGAHGAFTWGVLDALLDDGRLDIRAITGTSAGAMNAVVCADGFVEGGAEGARLKLEAFWRRVSRHNDLSPLRRSCFERLLGGWSLSDSPAFALFEAWSRYVSPYDANPLNLNPLRDFLAEMVDFPRLRAGSPVQLFVSATNVRTGKIRVFEGNEMTAEMVMASACLPQLFQAVEIGREAYWDGGYLGNPALFPLFYADTPDDVVLVQINPIRVAEVPQTARAIAGRLNEITFNASLLSEFRAISFVRRLIAEGALDRTRYRDIRMHRIALDHGPEEFDATSKLNTEWQFLTMLRDQGRRAARRFLARHFDQVGVEATLDLGDPAV